MRNILIGVLSIMLMPLVSSCNKGEVYFQFKKIDKGIWEKDKYLEFVIDSLPFNPTLNYNANIELIYSSLYPYYDLWLTINHNLTDSIFTCDTLKIKLINDDGKRLGSGNGGLYQLSVPYKHSLSLDSTSIYSVQVSNAMKDNNLVGISKVGLNILNSVE